MKQNEYILDGHKLLYHKERVEAFLDGKRIAPITIDWALTQECGYRCIYCYSQLQKNKQAKRITKEIALNFLDDAKEIGVKAVSLVSDGESTMVPFFYDVIRYGKSIGLDMAVGTCGKYLKKDKLKNLLKDLTYLRFNISGSNPEKYSKIHGVPEHYFNDVISIIKKCVEIKNTYNYDVTIGLQMVLYPSLLDQVIPLAKLGKELGVDYFVIKHCSDDEMGSLKVDYSKYKDLEGILNQAESFSTDGYVVKAKWSKIRIGDNRTYRKCYGPSFLLQVSGSGVVAACGSFFSPKYKKFHIGNILENRLKDIYYSDRYMEVMNYIKSDCFNAMTDCERLCIHDKINEFINFVIDNKIDVKYVDGEIPHKNFV